MFRVRFWHALVLLLGLAAGCQGTTTTSADDTEVLRREGERLRKEHQKEMFNK